MALTLRALAERLKRLELKTVISLTLLTVFVIFTIAMTVYGAELFDEDRRTQLIEWVRAPGHHAIAPLLMIFVFVVGGVSGVFPQFLMIGVAGIVFGAAMGFVVSWTGTMIACAIGFWLGARFGADLLKRFGGRKANLLSRKVGEHGILATIVMRNVPSGPFIVVNMAAGASDISFAKFMIGSGIGSIPKMAFVSITAAQSVELLNKPDLGSILTIVGVALLWLFGGIWLNRRMKRWQEERMPKPVVTPESAPGAAFEGRPETPAQTEPSPPRLGTKA